METKSIAIAIQENGYIVSIWLAPIHYAISKDSSQKA